MAKALSICRNQIYYGCLIMKNANENPILIKMENVSKSFITSERQELLVLDSINFTLQEGEIVSLLGKSGSGKSTLLRLMAGLVKPSSGQLFYRNQQINQPVQGVAMVFQSFALLPWLTVLENVELGLEALGVDRKERRQRALNAIDTIGLDGFESAYPKELSGGMRQRVGFARALVVEPDILLMDEPFSALDILTTDNLRSDLLDLWGSKRTKIKGIICVTHDIEEAILMADRVAIFTSDPGTIQAEIKVKLPYPRDTESAEFKELLDQIYMLMTTSERARVAKAQAKAAEITTKETHPEYAYRLPEVDISGLTGLVEAMEDHEVDDHVNLPELAESLHLDVNNVFPLTEVLDMLRFAKITEGELIFTEAGKRFAAATIQERKQIFAQHLLEYIPLAQHIRQVLDQSPNHRTSQDTFLDELENYFSEEESERILRTIIDWGRYAEILAYDYDSGELSLENPQ
jgi:NitT/TauT family transport system ATP-binding protein